MNSSLFLLILNFVVISSLGEQLETTSDKADDLILRSVDDKKEFPKETQMAQCTVHTTDGLQVQAQATFSKTLDGICSTDDMRGLEEKLMAMERRLYMDIAHLQRLIQKILPATHDSYRNDYQPTYGHESNNYASSSNQNANSHRQPQNQAPRENQQTENDVAPITTTVQPAIENVKSHQVINANMLKSLNTNRNKNVITTPKTIETTEAAKISPKNEYTFYWKLDNFPKAFQNAKKNEIFSHVFSVKGLFIRIRAMLNLNVDHTLLLDVEHLAENTEKIAVGMSDGLVFQEIAEEKIFQYIFVILDQNNAKNVYKSPTFWNNDNDNFLIPDMHVLKSFLKENSLLIKLVISF